MTWTFSTSFDDFRTRAGAFLAAHPAENTVLLTIAHRLAGPADRELLIRWYEEFTAEAAVPELPHLARVVDDNIAAGGLHLWEDGDSPVAMAGTSPVLAGMSRVGPVYTPRDRRGRGYASAVTAAASAHALDRGAAEVLLYTDLSNPTSNSIYQQIGYRPVEDCLIVDFARG
jgi:predicted GNAT family acetyltransferase